MPIAGLSFAKISGTKKKSDPRALKNIKTGVELGKIAKTTARVPENNIPIRIEFTWKAEYEPDVAEIVLIGDLLYFAETKKAEDLLKKADSKAPLPKEVVKEVLDYVLYHCNVQGIGLAKDIGLPSPIRLSGVSFKEAKK
ncbi:MAG: hypothetical protein H6502_03815 [Candidatus Woesearchaeota archaeon]|nr:MAG: hypothetical protein H6502_03815 [Candidatus Woesearchaeota archaeon]